MAVAEPATSTTLRSLQSRPTTTRRRQSSPTSTPPDGVVKVSHSFFAFAASVLMAAGNMATNLENFPEIARAAQDVDTPAHHDKEARGTYHFGMR